MRTNQPNQTKPMKPTKPTDKHYTQNNSHAQTNTKQTKLNSTDKQSQSALSNGPGKNKTPIKNRFLNVFCCCSCSSEIQATVDIYRISRYATLRNLETAPIVIAMGGAVGAVGTMRISVLMLTELFVQTRGSVHQREICWRMGCTKPPFFLRCAFSLYVDQRRNGGGGGGARLCRVSRVRPEKHRSTNSYPKQKLTERKRSFFIKCCSATAKNKISYAIGLHVVNSAPHSPTRFLQRMRHTGRPFLALMGGGYCPAHK